MLVIKITCPITPSILLYSSHALLLPLLIIENVQEEWITAGEIFALILNNIYFLTNVLFRLTSVVLGWVSNKIKVNNQYYYSLNTTKISFSMFSIINYCVILHNKNLIIFNDQFTFGLSSSELRASRLK